MIHQMTKDGMAANGGVQGFNIRELEEFPYILRSYLKSL